MKVSVTSGDDKYPRMPSTWYWYSRKSLEILATGVLSASMLGSIEGCLHQLMRGSTPVKSMSWATYTLSTVPWLMVTVAGRFALRSTAWSARRCMVRAVLLSNGSSTTAPLPLWVVLVGDRKG